MFISILKHLAATLAAFSLLVGPALGAGVTTYTHGPAGDVLLLRTQTTTIGTSGFCMDLFEDITASVAGEACDILGSNEVIWPQNAQVRWIVVSYIVTGDASDICDFVVESSGTVVGTAVAFPTQLGDTTAKKAYNINIADGDLIGIMVADGTSCASSAEYIVELWGSWVSDGAF